MRDAPQHALRGLGATAIALVALIVGAAPAGAHIQVRPTEAAPLDPTLWTVLVPNERNVATTRIELEVPTGLVPFSFEDDPGWRRSLTLARDKSIATIVWQGRLPEQGLASFSFLGTTPDRDGTLAWKALQTYADGQIVRWIGPPDAEEPASYTKVSKSVPRQNAGGESASGEDNPAGPQAAAQPAEEEDGDDGDATLALIVAGLALLIAMVALLRSVGSGRASRRSV